VNGSVEDVRRDNIKIGFLVGLGYDETPSKSLTSTPSNNNTNKAQTCN
jgi:hypothetical protein